jgi:hypothetical protein
MLTKPQKVKNKIRDWLESWHKFKVFHREEDRIGFLKISRWICIVLWIVSFIKFLDDASTLVPMCIFSGLIIVLTIYLPDNERIP